MNQLWLFDDEEEVVEEERKIYAPTPARPPEEVERKVYAPSDEKEKIPLRDYQEDTVAKIFEELE